MAVIGGIIGSGIFLNPAIVAQRLGSSQLIILAWALGGVVALLGAFIYGELGARLPAAGGSYAYLRAAFGPLAGFMYAWALLLIIATGAVAAVAYTFASYLLRLLDGPPGWAAPVGAAAIAVLSLINAGGVKPAAWTQNVFTVLKLAALATLIVAGFLATPSSGDCATCPPVIPPTGAGPITLAIAAALVPILFSYGGWQQTNDIAEELIDAERTLPRALVLGVIGVVSVYVLANLAYLRVLGPAALARSTAPASDTLERAFAGGRTFAAVGIIASTFGFLNLVILVSPRVYQAMARDGLFFKSFARLHPASKTPVTAILFQGAWAILLLFSGTYGQLLDYVVFADWIFFGSTALALFVFRRRGIGAGSGFRTPAYPVTVLLFVAAAVYVVVGSVWSNPTNALRGILLLGLGVPVYLWWSRRAPAPA
jgi:APA family basic amino acid/polyamine antiporter